MGNSVHYSERNERDMGNHVDNASLLKMCRPKYYGPSLHSHHDKKTTARSVTKAKYRDKDSEFAKECHDASCRLGDTLTSQQVNLALTNYFESTIAAMPHCTQHELILYKTLYSRAIHALRKELQTGAVCVPSEKWHQHFSSVPGVGMSALALIMQRIRNTQSLRPRLENITHDERDAEDASTKTTATTTTTNSSAAGAVKLTAGSPSHQELPHPHRVLTLNLTNLNLGDDSLSVLLPVFLHRTGVRHVLLARNNLTDRAIQTVIQAFNTDHCSDCEGKKDKQSQNDIETLDLSDNPISPAGLKALAENAHCLPQLSSISLGNSRDTTVSKKLQAESTSDKRIVPADLQSLPSSTIDADVAAALGDMVRESKKMRVLKYKGRCTCHTSSECDALEKPCPVRCEGQFTSAGLVALLQRVAQNCTLSELHLLHCYHTRPTVPGAASSAVSSTTARDGSAKSNSRGRRTASDKNRHSCAGKDARCENFVLCEAKKSGDVATSSKSSHMSEVCTVEEVVDLLAPMRVLAEALVSPFTHLHTLTLRFALTDEAMELLANGLAHATTLRRLLLGGCELGVEGLRWLAEGIALNRTLVLLDVSSQGDAVTPPAVLRARALAGREGLSHPASWLGGDVTRLERPSAECGDRPLLPLIRALRVNHVVETLRMKDIRLVHDDVEELYACLERFGNCGLMAVEYTGTDSEALTMKLAGLLRINRTSTEAARVRAEEAAARRRRSLTSSPTAASLLPSREYAYM